MALTINDIQLILEKYLPKEKLTKLSFDNINNFSVVTSESEWFNFDEAENGHTKLCTIDSIEIRNNKIIFAEFKNEEIKSGSKLKFLRLKANESILSLSKLVKKEIPQSTHCDLFQIPKECYFVFSKSKTRPTQLLSFNTTHRLLRQYYENDLFIVFDFIDCETFKRKFLN